MQMDYLKILKVETKHMEDQNWYINTNPVKEQWLKESKLWVGKFFY